MTVLGITGNVAMGKSTATQYISRKGFPVLQSDEVVGELLKNNQDIIADIANHFPKTVINNIIDKAILRQLISTNPDNIKILEKIIHPSVIESYQQFIKQNENAELVVIEVPLLYESELEDLFDCVLVLHCSADEQKKRVMKRPGISNDFLAAIIKRQMPIDEKIAKANFSINTEQEIENTMYEIDIVLNQIMKGKLCAK